MRAAPEHPRPACAVEHAGLPASHAPRADHPCMGLVPLSCFHGQLRNTFSWAFSLIERFYEDDVKPPTRPG